VDICALCAAVLERVSAGSWSSISVEGSAGVGDIPVFVGGTVPPQAIPRLTARGVEVFPPGSSLGAIVDSARRLTGRNIPNGGLS